MSVRVEVVTPCKHGFTVDVDCGCDVGVFGSRRTFTEWPLEAIEAVRQQLRHRPEDIDAALAVLWGHITGDK